MNQQHINSHLRVLKIVADVLNSKPTDWKAEGIEGNSAEQFVTVFRSLYDQGLEEQNCLPVEIRIEAIRDVEYSYNTELQLIAFGIDGELTTMLTLRGPVIDDWAYQA